MKGRYVQNDFDMVDLECGNWLWYHGLATTKWKRAMAVDKISWLCYNVFIGGCGAVGHHGCVVLKESYDQ